MGGLFKSSKSKTVSGPAAYTAPYVQGALQNTQNMFQAQQPLLDAYGAIAGIGGAAMAPGAFERNPFVDNAQGAARAISNGAFLGGNPGQSTYDRMQGIGAPKTGGIKGNKSGRTGGGMMSPRPASDPSMGLLSGMARPGTNPADRFASKVAGGQYLNNQPSAGMYGQMMDQSYSTANPFLDDMIRQTGEDVRTNTNRMFAARGMGSGISSAFADVMSKNLADSGNALRYQNYNDGENRRLQAGGQSDAAWSGERGRMDASTGLLAANYNANQDRALAAAQSLGGQHNAGQDRALDAARASDASQSNQVAQILQALGLTGQLSDAQYAGVEPTLDALKTGATLPLLGLDQYNNAIANLTGATNSSTSKSSGPGLMYNVWSNAASSLSDRRTKKNIQKVDVLEDGLGVYDFDYIDPAHGEGRFRGVMADEVAQLRPWALGPLIDGEFATVNYGAL